MKRRTAIFFTGGTISMRFDAVSGGAIPAWRGEDLLAMVPGLEELAELEPINFSLLPGPHMVPGRMLELARAIRERLRDERIAGAVVTHGTDTLEECAYVADRVLDSEKPVVFVGAMRNSSEPGWDGPANLRAAIRVAVAPEMGGLGVLVMAGDQVLSAVEATKIHSESLASFQARDFGPLALVDKDRLVLARRPVRRRPLDPARLEERVEIAKLSAGSDAAIVQFLADAGCRGIVLEGLGRGNVPLPAVDGIRRVAALGIPLVLVSRCPYGRVLDTYAYEGGGRPMRAMGVILGGMLPAHKARLELMLLLGAGCTVEQIRDQFDHA